MAENTPEPRPGTTQVTTTNLQPAPVGTPVAAPVAAPAVVPAAAPVAAPAVVPEMVAGAGTTGIPDTAGVQAGSNTADTEEVIWEGRYSLRNFIGRLVIMGLVTAFWIYWLAYDSFILGHPEKRVPATVFGLIVMVFWLMLAYRIFVVRLGHFYRLTSRRLFVMSGLFTRRRDQVELIKINDVFTRQNMSGRLLSTGTVVVNTSEKAMPTMYLAGVDDPKGIMDMVWKYSRGERDKGTVKVDHV